MRTTRRIPSAAFLAAAAAIVALAAPVAGFRIEGPTQTQHILYFAKLPSHDPPFLHWDLREFPNCQVPYSYINGTADIAGTTEFDAIDAGFQAWQGVTPAVIGFTRVAAPGGAMAPGHMDGVNAIGWVSGFGAGISGDDAWLVPAAQQVCGANVGANTPIIGPGADGWLNTLANNCVDDVCVLGAGQCAYGANTGTPNRLIIGAGANGALETQPNNADEWDPGVPPLLQFCGGFVGANVTIIQAGPDGVLNATPNNCGPGDDMMVGTTIHAGADGLVNTDLGDDAITADGITAGADGIVQTVIAAGDDAYTNAGQITAGPDGIVNTIPSGNIGPFTFALTPSFFNVNTGQILECDIVINDLYTWSDVANAATMAGKPDVRSVMTHEIGHFFGLHHPNQALVNPPGAPNGPIMNAFFYLNDDVYVVPPAQQLCAAIVGAVGTPIIAPGPDGSFQTALNNCPGGNDALNATGNRITSGADNELDTTIQPDRAVHTLHADDVDGINFLYTPDLGDAPDPFAAMFNFYQTHVQSPANGRMLNGVQLKQPARGPVHLFQWQGTGPTANSRFEWMGNTVDTAPLEECGPWLPNQDSSDDGVAFGPTPLDRGFTHTFTVTLRHNNQPGRYNGTAVNDQWVVPPPNQLCGGNIVANGVIMNDGGNGFEVAPNNCGGGDDMIVGNQIVDGGDGIVSTVIPFVRNRQLYFNGYFDFPGDGRFDAGELEIWWAGFPPGTTTQQSPNLTNVNFDNPNNRIILTFDVLIPLNAANGFYCRNRLDYGEDEARVANWSADLGPAERVAHFGEVEDDRITTQDSPTPVLLAAFQASPAAEGIELRWRWSEPALFAEEILERAGQEGEIWSTVAAERRQEDGFTVALDRDALPGRIYRYRLIGLDGSGARHVFGPIEAATGTPITEFGITALAPNPSPDGVSIEFTVPHEGPVSLSVVDVQGREVASLAEGVHRPGRYQIGWSGVTEVGRAPAGVYFVRLIAPGRQIVRRIAIIR